MQRSRWAPARDPTGIVRPVTADDTTTYTVGELNRLIRQALARRFPDEVWVEGEIRGLKRHERSGHVYFELVDSSADGRQADAVIQVALYKSDKEAVNRLLKRVGAVRMDDGVHIRIRGSIDYYPPQGRLQLRMQWIDPEHTLGRLEAERRRLLDALRVEGLIDRNRSLPYPLLPLRVGLVTSVGSAAHQDFLHELTASRMAWKVRVVHAAVQGPAAEIEVAAALRTLGASDVDVIAVVRGGGARTDLAAFDTESVARTIAALAIPVLTGIGHETDQVVADLVAARASKTPTACAAQLVADATAAHERARRAWDAIAARSSAALDRHRHDLETVATHVRHTGLRTIERRAEHVERSAVRVVRRATDAPVEARHDVDRIASAIATRGIRLLDHADVTEVEHRRRLVTAAPRSLRRHGSDLASRAAIVAAADPTRLLARGWAIVRTADGAVVASVDDLEVGDELVTTVADGSVRSTVVATHAVPPARVADHRTRPDDERTTT
jgi:exodeoxyribonuclease VII large subunit